MKQIKTFLILSCLCFLVAPTVMPMNRRKRKKKKKKTSQVVPLPRLKRSGRSASDPTIKRKPTVPPHAEKLPRLTLSAYNLILSAVINNQKEMLELLLCDDGILKDARAVLNHPVLQKTIDSPSRCFRILSHFISIADALHKCDRGTLKSLLPELPADIPLLHFLAYRGYYDLIRVGFLSGFFKVKKAPDNHINERGRANNTALHYAVAGAHLLVVDLLLELGASDHVCNGKGDFPHDLARKQQECIAKNLHDGLNTLSQDEIILSKYKLKQLDDIIVLLTYEDLSTTL